MNNKSLVKQFKSHLQAEAGIELDFRKHQFLENHYNATPCFNYEFAQIVVRELYKWAHSYINIHKENYPDFSGWQYNLQMSCEELRTTRLKTVIECVCETLLVRFTEKYRFDHAYGSAYEYSNGDYMFIGKLNGRTERQFINDYEKMD